MVNELQIYDGYLGSKHRLLTVRGMGEDSGTALVRMNQSASNHAVCKVVRLLIEFLFKMTAAKTKPATCEVRAV